MRYRGCDARTERTFEIPLEVAQLRLERLVGGELAAAVLVDAAADAVEGAPREDDVAGDAVELLVEAGLDGGVEGLGLFVDVGGDFGLEGGAVVVLLGDGFEACEERAAAWEV